MDVLRIAYAEFSEADREAIVARIRAPRTLRKTSSRRKSKVAKIGAVEKNDEMAAHCRNSALGTLYLWTLCVV